MLRPYALPNTKAAVSQHERRPNTNARPTTNAAPNAYAGPNAYAALNACAALNRYAHKRAGIEDYRSRGGTRKAVAVLDRD